MTRVIAEPREAEEGEMRTAAARETAAFVVLQKAYRTAGIGKISSSVLTFCLTIQSFERIEDLREIPRAFHLQEILEREDGRQAKARVIDFLLLSLMKFRLMKDSCNALRVHEKNCWH